MRIADALSGSAGLEGIRWILTRVPSRALRRELSALLIPPNVLGPCRLRLTRFKPGRRFSAFYDAQIRVEGSDVHNIRPIAVTWKLKGDGGRRRAVAKLAEMESEAAGRGVAAPFRKLSADAPALGMHISVSPLDVRYPQLVRLSDPQYVRGMVGKACARGGGMLEHAPAKQYSVKTLRYRPGKRHVLRYDPLDAPKRGVLFAKLYSTSEEGERVFRLAKMVGEWLAKHGEGIASARPPAYVADDGVVLCPQAPGTPLSEHLRRPNQSLARSLRNAGAALYALHQLPSADSGSLTLRDFAAEVQNITEVSDHICALLPSVGKTLEALLDRAQELHERLPLEPPTFTYGELKAEHVWVGSDGLALIDFDGCCLGDPALDLGKFLADLQFWCAVYGQYELRQAQEQFLAGYGSGASVERVVRARLYEAIELVKQTVRRVRTLGHGWARRTERLINCAQVVLDDLQVTLGLGAKRSPGHPLVSSALRPNKGSWHRQPSARGGLY